MSTRACRICGRLTVALPEREGRCVLCARHWLRRGVERFAPPRRPCTTCGRLVLKLTSDRCPACYRYWYRRGHERPARLWSR
jgi:hypothetical protein